MSTRSPWPSFDDLLPPTFWSSPADDDHPQPLPPTTSRSLFRQTPPKSAAHDSLSRFTSDKGMKSNASRRASASRKVRFLPTLPDLLFFAVT
ncbi:hypothetical protein JCM8547_002707 [Rhodosporidiobolus lusitaniae]